MTAKISYDAVETLVFDPVAANRETTRVALDMLGFRKLEAVATFDQFAERLSGTTPDVIFFEVVGAEAELCRLVQSLRQGLTGTNPFTAVMATAWRHEDALVKMVINSGADDMLARPFTGELLGDRLWQHVERRKAFVVTTDYIGPDRRRDPRSDSANLIEVPNSLRTKAIHGAFTESAERDMAAAIAKTQEAINVEKIRRDAFQLCLQWRLIEQRTPSARDLSDTLARMAQLAGEVKRRSTGTEQQETAKWCEAVIECAEAIGTTLQYSDGGNPSRGPAITPMMQLLGHAAITLGELFAPGETKPALLDELDAVAARIDVRRPMQAAS